MLYGYRRPSGITWTVAGTGADFASDVLLDDGQPSHVTAITWLSADPPAIGDYIDLRGSWATAIPPRVISILGLSCGAGVRVEIVGKRAADAGFTYALGGNSATQRTVAQADGRIDLIVVCAAGLDPIVGIQIRIYNDSGGGTWATAATDLIIGEVSVWAAVTLCGKPGWSDAMRDPSVRTRTLAGSMHVWAQQAYRVLTVQLQKGFLSPVREMGLENGQDWQTLRAATAGDSRAVLIVDTSDALAIHRTSLFGMPTMQDIKNREGSKNHYDAALVIDEVR